jgi:8-oxo-dGTP pyrophosphatase MutT (NUDIX family)
MATLTGDQRRRLLQRWLASGPSMVRPDDCPGWLAPLVNSLRQAQPRQLSTNDPLASRLSDRQAAVLILIGGVGPDEATVVLTERAVGLRDHPGEVSFPGGSWEHGDASPVATALREAAEETGVDPADITPWPCCQGSSFAHPDSTSRQSSDTGTGRVRSRRPIPPKRCGTWSSTSSPRRAAARFARGPASESGSLLPQHESSNIARFSAGMPSRTTCSRKER